MTDFGRHSYVTGLSFTGPTDPKIINNLVLDVIDSINMTPIFDSKVFHWTEDGVGFIHVQCLYESCVLVDVWPKHEGGFMLVVSCKKYDLDPIVNTMHSHGFKPMVCRDFSLWL